MSAISDWLGYDPFGQEELDENGKPKEC